MGQHDLFYDIATHSLNKVGEELCGDNVEVFKSDDRITIVLADGLGSGVKANILATLTTKIAGTMLQNGSTIDETMDTIMQTLPVCQIRKIAYSTLGIIEIDKNNIATVIQYDNPPIFFKRGNQIIPLEHTVKRFGKKTVKLTRIPLQLGDTLTLVSDGVIHAGVGKTLNHGWEWEHVASYLEGQMVTTSEVYNKRLIDTCNKLYENNPGDDTTAVTLKVKLPSVTHLLTGPPQDKSDDAFVVKKFMAQKGKKIVCGGTAANIFARELDEEIKTSFDYIDPNIPPTASINGLDLVTEGVLTLKYVLNLLETMPKRTDEVDFNKKDGATLLLKALLEESTHIVLWVGKAINPAHQNPDFPMDLSIKLNIVGRISNCLKKFGKEIEIRYI